MYAIGVGKGVVEAELRQIASSQENVFKSASFKELQPLAVKLRKRLCNCKFMVCFENNNILVMWTIIHGCEEV